MRTAPHFTFCRLALLALLVLSATASSSPQSSDEMPKTSQNPQRQSPEKAGTALAQRFAHGQTALREGDLIAAGKDFRAVIAGDPKSAAAYANLGVIAMRQKAWDRALKYLNEARRLDPKTSGIRLNIGLVEYRRGDYADAIAPLASVVADQPDSQQARYLLGLSYIFTNHFSEAVDALYPLWAQRSDDVMYLYVLDIAAHSSGQKELDEKVLARLLEVSSDTPQFHLILGKAYLYRRETDKAIAELEVAKTADAALPYVHFNLGVAYLRAGEDEKAEAEFKQDIAVESDVADNYEQLGTLYLKQGKNDDAEKALHEALQRDPALVLSLTSLAKIYLKQDKEKLALSSVDAAVKYGPKSQSAHFLRGQVLMRIGRPEQAKTEFAEAQKLLDSGLDRDRETYGEAAAGNPELTKQPM